jgi:FtsH-binding integral membrane protein
LFYFQCLKTKKNMNQYSPIVSEASQIERTEFYKKTYLHVAFAILAFIVLETFLLNVIPADVIYGMMSTSFVWLIFIGLFWVGSIVADKLAMSMSREMQYLGLGFFALLEAIIFLPMIYMAIAYSGMELIMQAATVTLAMFGGLTALVFTSGYDFSFLRTGLIVGGFISIGLVVAGALFGFNLGLWFSVGMVLLASGSILYQTSQIKNIYTTDQYVGAALQIFSSVMLLFWYVLRIFMSRD